MVVKFGFFIQIYIGIDLFIRKYYSFSVISQVPSLSSPWLAKFLKIKVFCHKLIKYWNLGIVIMIMKHITNVLYSLAIISASLGQLRCNIKTFPICLHVIKILFANQQFHWSLRTVVAMCIQWRFPITLVLLLGTIECLIYSY